AHPAGLYPVNRARSRKRPSSEGWRGASRGLPSPWISRAASSRICPPGRAPASGGCWPSPDRIPVILIDSVPYTPPIDMTATDFYFSSARLLRDLPASKPWHMNILPTDSPQALDDGIQQHLSRVVTVFPIHDAAEVVRPDELGLRLQ